MVIGICIIIAAVAFVGGYYLNGSNNDQEEAVASASPTPSVTVSATPKATVAYKPTAYTVSLTAGGLTPASLSVRVGDSVSLRNDSNVMFWPASDPHPAHTMCPGFDALRGLANGESYTLTFTKAQTCGYHNHLDPATRGTITVR